MTLTEAVKQLDSPYTYRRVKDSWHWWFRDRLGEKFEIVYDDSMVLAELRDSKENVETMTGILNSAYRAGIADTFSLLQREKMISE